MENISNYFAKTTDQKPEISARALGPDVIIESPYQNLSADIRPIINTSITEENDFKTPKPIKRIAKIFDTKTSSKNKKIRSKSKSKSKWSGNKSSKKQHATTKIVGDNFQNSDVNAEQLQMALALSKSIQDNESSSEHEDDLKTLYPSTQQKLATIKQTLEQFGFKPSKSKVDVEKIISEKLPKPKKSKYQYVTPILYIRTEEDRESLISSKISLILSNAQEEPATSNNTEINLFSKYLKKLHCTHADIFKQSRLGSEHENFYVKNFNLSPCKLKCGHLLKRWEDIPGRDATPPRELTTMEKTNIQIAINVDTPPNEIENKCNQFVGGISDDEKQEIVYSKLVRKSLSPDLFSSDEDDYQITKINRIIDDKLESSFEILDNIKHAHLQANNIYQPLNLASPRNKSTASYPFKRCNLSLDNVNSKSVLSISTTVHENVILRKNFDVFSASMLSNFETTMGDESCLKTTEFSDSENVERGNNFELFNDLTQSSDTENTPMKCTYNNDDVTDNVTSLMKIDGETQNTIDPQTSGSLLSKSQTISDKSCLSDGSDELLDLTQSSDGSYEDHKISEVKTDIDFDQINEYKLKFAENKNSIVKNHTSLNLNDKYELCELSYSDIGNLQNINNSSNETVTESNKRNSFEMDKTESQNNKPVIKLRQNRLKIIELISDSDTEIEENVESNKKPSEYDTMSPPLKLCSNRLSETEDSKGVCDDECSEQNIQSCDYTFETLDKTKVNQQFTKHDSFKSATSECSQESVYISDEELNYSSVYSTLYVKKSTNAENICKRTSYEFSDDSAADEVTADGKNFEDERNNQSEQSNNVGISNETTTFKNVTGEKHDFKNDTMAFVDELLNNTNYKCYRLNKMEGEITSTVENQSIVRNHINMDYNEYLDDHSMNRDYTPTDIVDEHMTTVDNQSIYQLNSLLNNSDKSSTSHKLLNNTKDLLHIENRNQTISEHPGYLNICKNDELPTTPKNKTQAQNNVTPGGTLFIKTDNVTPVPPYESMNSPKIAAELEKFGLKNLKRKRGIQMLKHIYESTHPMIELTNEDINDVDEVIKRRKRSEAVNSQNLKNHPSSRNSLSNTNNCDIFNDAVMHDGNIEIIGDLLSQNVPDQDLIFEKKQSVKVASCRIPLHIVWHNLTSSQPKLKENILLYEPLQLEVLYATLKENGFKFDIKDLLTFLEKKCITVRTNQHHQVKKKNTK